MGMKTLEKLAVRPGEHSLKNYQETAANHDWGNTEKAFSWYETGKVNIAYEAIDRHVDTHRKAYCHSVSCRIQYQLVQAQS